MGSQRVDPVAVDPVTSRQVPWINQMSGMLQNVPGQTNIDAYRQPSAAESAGSNYLNDVLGGKYLNQSNPYMQGMVNAATRPVQDWYGDQSRNLASQANMLGMSSSTPRLDQQTRLADQAGKQIGDMTSNLYGQNYANERAMQQNALGAAAQYSMLPLQRASAIQGLEMAPWQAQLGGLSQLLNLTRGQVATPEYSNSAGDTMQGLGSLLGLFL